MTAKNRPTIKAVFEQGDKPQGSDYEDMIDSYLSVADTTAQSLSSPLVVTGAFGASTTVSAPSIETSALFVTGAISAESVFVSALSVIGTVSANVVAASAVSFTTGSAANWSVGALTLATAMVTASAVTGAGQTLPNQVKGFVTVEVCGVTVMIPYFPVT